MASIFDAAKAGDLSRLEAILDGGGNVDQKNEVGWTALHLAACYGHVTATALLLDRGADLRVGNIDGWTALHWAAWNGHVTAMALLIDRGADLSATAKDGDTALHFAARYNHVTAMALLLDRGANLSATDKFGNTARMLCGNKGVVTIDSFVANVSGEWRPSRHLLYPHPFRRAVATVVALWSWNLATNAPWHADSPFSLLPLEILEEVIIWLAAEIASFGYVVVTPVSALLCVQKKKGTEEDDGL